MKPVSVKTERLYDSNLLLLIERMEAVVEALINSDRKIISTEIVEINKDFVGIIFYSVN